MRRFLLQCLLGQKYQINIKLKKDVLHTSDVIHNLHTCCHTHFILPNMHCSTNTLRDDKFLHLHHQRYSEQISTSFSLLVAMAIWHGYSMYGFQVLSQSAQLSEFQALI